MSPMVVDVGDVSYQAMFVFLVPLSSTADSTEQVEFTNFCFGLELPTPRTLLLGIHSRLASLENPNNVL